MEYERKTLIGHFSRFSQFYKGRERGIWERGQFEAGEKNGTFLPDDEFTLERFVEHVGGNGRSYGIHLLDSQNRVRFCMFDIDAYPRTAPQNEMVRNLRALKPSVIHMRNTLYAMGVDARNLLIEFSGTGFHLWMFYDVPIAATEVKAWMSAALERSELDGIPFKPQRIEITDKHNGDKVWLPLRINSNQGNRSVFIRDLEGFDPENYDQKLDFTVIEKVVPMTTEDLRRISAQLGPA